MISVQNFLYVLIFVCECLCVCGVYAVILSLFPLQNKLEDSVIMGVEVETRSSWSSNSDQLVKRIELDISGTIKVIIVDLFEH